MSDYDSQPCSVFYPKQPGVTVPPALLPVPHQLHQPRVVENLTPQKPAEEAPVVAKKKSCLSTASSRRPIPDHPANHRKTVAFGKTVNVSQTVEGTSRLNKKMASTSSANSSPAARPIVTASAAGVGVIVNEEGQEDWRNMKDEMEMLKRQMHEESVKREEDSAKQQEAMNKMQEMMAQVLQQVVVSKPAAATEDKENYERRYQESRPKPPNKIAIARQTIKREGRIPPEAIPFLERRIQSDPIFRQQVDDVLADAEYDYNRDSYSPPPPVSYAGGGNNTGAGNPALMRETLTVERSIRYDNGLSSIDSRQWTKERTDGGRGGQERWRTYEPDPALHSTYQPGNSVSYYPSAVDRNRQNHHNRARNDGYYVEHTSDQDEDEIVDDYAEPAVETAAERERRIREKYSRKR